MATIVENKLKDGIFSYKLQIRKPNHPEIFKTFNTREDAEIYAFYKERLIDNMENFEVPIEQRITLKQVFELKIQDSKELAKRSVLDMENAFNLIHDLLDYNRFVYNITLEDWEKTAKSMYDLDVFMGAKTEAGKRKMSPLTLRRNFACASAAFSTAIGKGFKIENHPLKILQTFINPMLKDLKKDK
tara:strand:+ start:825 stop:1385 length:561 start_codon:yes stop_codon:yes gene_type:complete